MKTILSLFILFFLIVQNKLTYSDGWVELNSGVTTSLNSISVPNSNIRWVCGASGTVIKSSYGFPITFSNANTGIPSTINLVNICAIDQYTALAAGNIDTVTYVYKTTNGGVNWSQVFTQTNAQINAICMRNSSTGIMVGNPVGARWSIWRTTNGKLMGFNRFVFAPGRN